MGIKPRAPSSTEAVLGRVFLTFRYSTGLVTLNLSMVEMMMAGVVRKKRRMKRIQLMMKQRIHQEIPPSDRCSLQKKQETSSAQSVCLEAPGFQWVECADIPADVLRVGRIRHAPVVNVKNFTELGRTWLLVTSTALNLAGVKVLQDAENRRDFKFNQTCFSPFCLNASLWAESGSHGGHGLVLEGDEGHAQRLGVDFLLLLPVLLLQLGLRLGVEAHGLLLQDKHESHFR